MNQTCELCNNPEYKVINGARFGKIHDIVSVRGQRMCEDCRAKQHSETVNVVNCFCCGLPQNDTLLVAGERWCRPCIKRENELREQSSITAESRVLNMQDMITKAKEIDSSITVSTDIFNAETVAIMDVFKSIDASDEISTDKKQVAKAEFMMERFNHFKTVIFELNQEVIESVNKQRAYQQQLNVIANQLRQEERDRLKIADINYKPSAPKIVTPRVTKPKSSKPKFDKVELRKVAAELGVNEFTLQMVCVSKNLTPAEAGKILRETLQTGKSLSN